MMLPRDFISRCSRSFSEKVAYVDGERSRTWRQMHERSDGLAAGLQGLGIGKGDPVAILAHDRLEVLEHWYACMKIGALRTGINWRYADREMLHIIRDSDAKAIIVQDEHVPSLEEHLPELQDEGRQIIGFGEGHGLPIEYETLIEVGASPELPELSEDGLIAISYTSGTTGLPKGAQLTQRGVRESLVHTTLAIGLRHEDVWAAVFPTAGITLLIASFNLVNGMTVVLPDGYFQPKRFLELVEEHGITSTILVPTMLKGVTKEQQSGDYDISSLRLIAYGSMPATPALIRSAQETFGCDFQHWYGATEGTGGWYSFLLEDEHRRAIEDEPELLTSVGRPLLHIEMSVRDPESGDPMPSGEVGEVWVAGDIVMHGYLNQPEENEEVFRDGWLSTEDLGYFDELGYLYLVDRKSDMIISGGYNVYPVVVENVLDEHPAVREVAVMGVPHPEWGEAVVAAVALVPDEEATSEELIDFCRDKVGKWEVPKHVEIVEELPKGVTAKVQKHEVKAWFQDEPERLPWETGGQESATAP
jgi:acyl-CoA synthetase (AMP-forming)/AMP-acid ligase II